MPSAAGERAWLDARVAQLQQAWTAAGFPLTLIGVVMHKDTAVNLKIMPAVGMRVVQVSDALSLFVLPDSHFQRDVFELRPAVSADWPIPVSSVASLPVRGYLYPTPVPSADVETRWVLEGDGLTSEEARRAAQALA